MPPCPAPTCSWWVQASVLLLCWGSYHWARNLWVLIIYFSSWLCCPLWFQGSPQTRQWECFLVFGNFSLFKTPFPGRSSVPISFVSLFVFYIFAYLLLKRIASFLGASCPLLAFRSCFVEFTQRLNVLLMNLWGEKMVSLSYSSTILGPPLKYTFKNEVEWIILLNSCTLIYTQIRRKNKNHFYWYETNINPR